MKLSKCCHVWSGAVRYGYAWCSKVKGGPKRTAKQSHQTGDVVKTISSAEYHSSPAIGSTGLKKIAISPAHYQSWLKNPNDSTPDQEFGSMVHLALLEPELFFATHVVNPGIKRNTKEGKADFAIWESENKGKTMVDEDKWLKIQAMRESFLRNPLVIGALNDAKIEQSLFWFDPSTGMECKARPDIITTSGDIYDLKSAADVSAYKFGGDAAKFYYHLQAVHYLCGLSVVTGAPIRNFTFIAIEKSAPFGIKFYRLNSLQFTAGHKKWSQLMNIYAQCKQTNQWPGYPETIEDLQLPTYAL